VVIGRSGFTAGWGNALSRLFGMEAPGPRRIAVDTLESPAVLAGVLWPHARKGITNDRTQIAHDPGHAARRAG
jgi:hypothetical protein